VDAKGVEAGTAVEGTAVVEVVEVEVEVDTVAGVSRVLWVGAAVGCNPQPAAKMPLAKATTTPNVVISLKRRSTLEFDPRHFDDRYERS
jgi:hypothetical protein